jgi:hypothetical protein
MARAGGPPRSFGTYLGGGAATWPCVGIPWQRRGHRRKRKDMALSVPMRAQFDDRFICVDGTSAARPPS